MVMEVSLRQITVASQPERTFFLKVEWKEDFGAGFVILLCDGSNAWSGEGNGQGPFCLPLFFRLVVAYIHWMANMHLVMSNAHCLLSEEQ